MYTYMDVLSEINLIIITNTLISDALIPGYIYSELNKCLDIFRYSGGKCH